LRAPRFRKLSPLHDSVAWFMWAIESLRLLGNLHPGTSFLTHTGNLVPLPMWPELEPPIDRRQRRALTAVFSKPFSCRKIRPTPQHLWFFHTLRPSFSDHLERHGIFYELFLILQGGTACFRSCCTRAPGHSWRGTARGGVIAWLRQIPWLSTRCAHLTACIAWCQGAPALTKCGRLSGQAEQL
jgi:hypothetical protein